MQDIQGMSEKRLSELVGLMKDHQNSKKKPMAEIFISYSRNRKPEERISNYMAELCCLSQ